MCSSGASLAPPIGQPFTPDLPCCRQCKTVLLLVVDAVVFGVPTSLVKGLGAAIAIGGMVTYTYMNIKVGAHAQGTESSASPLFSPCKSPTGLTSQDIPAPVMSSGEKKDL
jgi:hypothetical protein